MMVTNGIADGVVSNQIEDDAKLSTLFWGVNIIGFCISILCLLFAAPFSNWMNEPELEMIMVWFSVIPFLISLGSIPNLLLLKELKFKVYAIRSILSVIVGGLIGLYMALNDFGAYAIVGQQIISYAVVNVVIWSSIKWRPSFKFDLSVFKQEIKPGLSVMGVNFFGFLSEQVPRFFIPILLGTNQLGYYALATRLRFTLTEIFVTSPLTVTYPALVKIRNNLQQQKNLSTSLIYLSSLILFPIIAISVATAPQFVPLFFGEKWHAAVSVIQIYIWTGATVATTLVIQQLFRANNKSHIFFKFNSLIVLANVACCSLLIFDNGLIIMGIGMSVVSIMSIPIYMRLLAKHIGVEIKKECSQLFVPILGSILSYITISFLASFLKGYEFNSVSILFLSILSGVAVYIAFIFAFQFSSLMLYFSKLKEITK